MGWDRGVNPISFNGYGFGIFVGYPMGLDIYGISHPIAADKIRIITIIGSYCWCVAMLLDHWNDHIVD